MPPERNEPLRPVLGGSEKDTTRLRRKEEMAGGQRAGLHRKAVLLSAQTNIKNFLCNQIEKGTEPTDSVPFAFIRRFHHLRNSEVLRDS